MIDLTPLPSRENRPETLDDDVEGLFQKLPTFGAELVALQANLNSIAAGGAYAIPYTYGVWGAIGLSTGTKLLFTPQEGAQSAANTLFLDTTDAGGGAATAILESFDDSSSVIKGTVRVTKTGDPSKWILCEILGQNGSGTYHRAFSISIISSSSPSPFAPGDGLMLHFQRTGDKGDMGSHPVFHLREEQASGTGGITPAFISTGLYQRPLNTAKTAEISGASLAGNQFTLPAGTYEMIATGHGQVTTGSSNIVYWHKLALFDATAGGYVSSGTAVPCGETAANSMWIGVPSLLQCKFTISVAKTFELRTISPSAPLAAGKAVGGILPEVYMDVYIKKVA